MRSNKIGNLMALAGISLLGSLGTVSAATVLCPGDLNVNLTRQIQVTGGLAGGECYYKEGNFQGDNFTTWLGSTYSLIEKDIAPSGQSTGNLNYGGSTSGTWGMASNFWNTYNEVFVAFHLGGGRGTPDSFIVELNPNTLSGTWALLPTNLANGLSNIYLIGRGPCTTNCGENNEVPEPGTLVLLGLGLAGVAAARRRPR